MTQAGNIIQTILQSGGGNIVGQLGQQFGLDNSQVNAAIQQLMPAISQGFRSNLKQENGAASLANALQNGQHAEYLNNPAKLSDTNTALDGNAILGHLFGSKEISRNVAANAANQTSISSSVLKQLLPVLASLAMGALSKQSSNNNLLAGLAGAALGGSSSSGGLGMLANLAEAFLGGNKTQAPNQNTAITALSSFLDSDGDGSVADDIMEMIARKAA